MAARSFRGQEIEFLAPLDMGHVEVDQGRNPLHFLPAGVSDDRGI
jgi:hypothetical protein